jgi:hypothetical protein
MLPLKKIIAVVIISALMCSSFWMLLKAGLKKYNHNTYMQFDVLFSDTSDYDVLFAGASRTHSGINPLVVDSITKLKTYNAGVDGANMYECKTIITAFLQVHKPPQCIVLNVDFFSFNTQQALFNYTHYLPYVKNKIIDSVLKENKHYTALQQTFPFLFTTQFNDDSKIKAVRGFFGTADSDEAGVSYKGYLALPDEFIQNDSMVILPYTAVMDIRGKNCLDEIITLCRDKNIKLFFMYPPEYKGMWQKNVKNADEIFAYIKAAAQLNHLSFYRYDTLPLNRNGGLFYNIRHLNNNGANLFSQVIAKDILYQLQPVSMHR